ncbi:MAG: hypothetical protein ACYC0F_13220 [Rhodanobacter sp.]
MKKIIMAAATALVLGAVGSVCATTIGGGVVKSPDPVQPVFGTFNATVKYTEPHRAPDGRYLTFSYLELTATTMEYCQNQLASVLTNGNVSVVTWCHQVN